MRREEIAQLRVENIKEAEGVKYFEIVKAKTQAGVRNVPIHPKLASVVKRLHIWRQRLLVDPQTNTPQRRARRRHRKALQDAQR